MSDLRTIFEGEDNDDLTVHIRRLSRLKNEWPSLYQAVTDEVYATVPREQRESLSGTLTSSNEFDVLATYLDSAIREWRKIQRDPDNEHQPFAPYYIDAFQSVRVSVLGDVLPYDDDDL